MSRLENPNKAEYEWIWCLVLWPLKWYFDHGTCVQHPVATFHTWTWQVFLLSFWNLDILVTLRTAVFSNGNLDFRQVTDEAPSKKKTCFSSSTMVGLLMPLGETERERKKDRIGKTSFFLRHYKHKLIPRMCHEQAIASLSEIRRRLADFRPVPWRQWNQLHP